MDVLRQIRAGAASGLLVGLVAAGDRSQAELITQTRALAGATAAVQIAPFDPAVGTLERVLVRIEGSLAQPVVAPIVAGPREITTRQRFFGLASRGFSFPSDAELLLTDTATSAPAVALRCDLVFDAASDLVGFAVPVASGPFLALPASVLGSRGSFELLPLPGDPGIEIDMVAQPGRVLRGTAQLAAPSFAGTLTVQYVYTVAVAPPLALDSSLLLLAETTATETLSVKAFTPDGDEVLVFFEAGAVRMPVVIGGLWNDEDGSVPVVHEDDAAGENAAIVKRLARGGGVDVVAALGGASGQPGAWKPRDTALSAERLLVIADEGPTDGAAPDGKLLGVSLASGEVQELPIATLVNPRRLAASPGSVLFVADQLADGSGVLVAVDVAGARVARVAAGDLLGEPVDLVLAPGGQLLWLNAPGVDGATLVRVDVATGAQVVVADRIEGARGLYLRSDRTLGQIGLPRIGIVSLSMDGLDAGSEQLKRYESEYVVEEFSFDFAAEEGAVAPGTQSPTSPTRTECNDGADADGDGATDLDDPGCVRSADRSERPDCDDDLDNDADRAIDGDDRGCLGSLDPSERPGCSDGLDGDGDGATDFPADPGCLTPDGDAEDPACDDRIDDDGDGAIDAADPDCLSAADSSEGSPACANGVDDDGDELSDFPADPGCRSAAGENEAPQCDDHVDNDLDRLVDAEDPGCARPDSAVEDPSCQDGLDNDGDGGIDFGIVGGLGCASYEDCTDEPAGCDVVCFGGPRDGEPCVGDAECRVDCVDDVCEEAAIPRLCEVSVDCGDGTCNSAFHCAVPERLPADEKCIARGAEVRRGIRWPCGLGGEVTLALWLLHRARSARGALDPVDRSATC